MGHHIAVCRRRPGLVLGAGLVVAGLVGCIEPLRGSNVQFDFAEGVPAVADRGATPNGEQPPADTFLALYAVDLEFVDADGDGRVDLDANGEPIASTAHLYEVHRFEIRKLINRASPCFIDIEGAPFPGVHVTQYGRKMRERIGIDLDDPSAPYDDSLPRNDAIDALTADRRMELLPRLENELKAVTSTDSLGQVGRADFQYPATAPVGTCADTTPGLADLPHPTCLDDASNALRLRLCQELWAEAGPDFYEGSDKVFTLPLNGKFYGLVEGENPINSGFVGGAGFYVDENLLGVDAYVVNWQYKDLDGDGIPDAPGGVVIDTGSPYLFGRTHVISRGVVSATMRNLYDSHIRAEMAVFPDLGSDRVNF
ncbi:MAG: hypothetical protein HS111_32435 [Kofleriaceae bacterium]|nr:hypothetical protein [Kofleriaceae bacterium]MCL4226445.1 hypothetical protein [Myxococcales bacterium]